MSHSVYDHKTDFSSLRSNCILLNDGSERQRDCNVMMNKRIMRISLMTSPCIVFMNLFMLNELSTPPPHSPHHLKHFYNYLE